MSDRRRHRTAAANALGLDDKDVLRSPPHNHEAEIQLLGAILSNNRAWEKVADFLKPEHFADDRHGRIYRACSFLITNGQQANPTTLKNYFEQDATLAELGGAKYLWDIAKAAVTVINTGEHGRIITDLYRRRQLISLGEDVVNAAYAHDLQSSAAEIISTHVPRLEAVVDTDGKEGGPRPIGVGIDGALEIADRARRDGKGGMVGLATGLTKVDAKLRGLRKGNLIILAGRPGMGKTAMAVVAAYNAANALTEVLDQETDRMKVVAGAKALIFSLEMTEDELGARILAGVTGITAERQAGGDLSQKELDEMVIARNQLAGMPLFIDDTPGLTLAKIRQRARRMHRAQGLGLIVIDYLQLIEPEEGAGSDINRAAELGRISRGLKLLSKELELPVIALSQVSRKVEEREDKRPQLVDLRESGAIEQDADVVGFIYRHEVYLAEEKPKKGPRQKDEQHKADMADWANELERCKGVAEVLFRKNRHGPTGTVRVRFHDEVTWFTDLTEGQ